MRNSINEGNDWSHLGNKSNVVQAEVVQNELKQDYLLQYHQESKIHNFDEILSMCKIIRNKKNVIVDELHKTIPILTKYEKTRILGERTKQINKEEINVEHEK